MKIAIRCKYLVGTEFNRKNTWFFQGKAFIDYKTLPITCCSRAGRLMMWPILLEKMHPKMTGIRNPDLPKGYQFDYINAEVIENRLQVKDGLLVLPDGMHYRLLVLPPLTTMRPALLKKIEKLVRDGAVILGTPPVQSPSLQNYPAADKEVKQIAAELWNTTAGSTVEQHAYGKGFVYNGITMEQAFDKLQLIPDFSTDKDAPVLYTHRSTDSAEIYFISNQADSIIEMNASFRVVNKQPFYWDAVTGRTRVMPVFTQSGQATSLPLKLVPYQSAFIIFKKKTAIKRSLSGENFPVAKNILQLNKPWSVRFDTAMRGPLAPVAFDSLTDWSSSNNEQIKNYSGTAVYNTSFNMQQLPAGEQLLLNLGAVNVMATVKLNGKTLGTVWTAPWQIDVTGYLKQGDNQLAIEVVNTWVNRLIGDSKLPAVQRSTWTNVNPYTPESVYQSSGLTGPVFIQSIKY